MSPVPKRGAHLKYPFDKAKARKPLSISLTGKDRDDTDDQVATIRVNACSYAKRHGIKLAVQIRFRSEDGTRVKLQVVNKGKRA